MLKRLKAHNASLLASAVAFWGMLALVPTLAALVSLYGLFADPADVERQVRQATDALPAEAQALVVSQLQAVVDSPRSGLGTGLAIGLAVALFAASAGMRTLTTAISTVYGVDPEDKGFARDRGKAIALTLGAVAAAGAGVFVAAIIPNDLPLAVLVQWVLLGIGLVVGVGALYRLGPTRHAEPRLVSPGSVTAALLTVIVSLVFSRYTSTFASFNETYGSLAAVVILLLWLQLSAMTVLIGAALNRVLATR